MHKRYADSFGRLALILVFTMLSACSGYNQVQAQTSVVAQSNQILAEVAERSVQSVVNVSTVMRVESPGRGGYPFPQGPMPSPRQQQGLGSGVIVSNDGIVLTNNHVVANASRIRVTAMGGREYDVEVVGTDPLSDVAVLRLKGDISGLRPMPFGSSENLRLGEMVLAVGNPLGLEHTVTMGIVSAKGRANVGIVDYEDFIQTDAAINPGNSGGALVNMNGELVGINTAIASQSGGNQGIGFAIPSDMARIIMNSIQKTGRFERGYLGINIQTLTPELAESLNLQAAEGVVVAGVQDDSPAAQAGIQRYDVITAVNGQRVTSAAELRNMISLQGPRKEVSLTLRRDGSERTVQVTLGELPTQERSAERSPRQGEDPETTGIGLAVRELNTETRQEFNIPGSVRSGVVVAAVQPGSRAAAVGFRPGDVILEVNRQPVNSVSQLRSRIRQSKGNVSMLVWRDGSTFLVLVEQS